MRKRAAVIDVGTNSIKLLAAEKTRGGFKTLEERIKVARLGEGLSQSRYLSEKAMLRAETAIVRFVALAKKYGAGEIAVFGTHALRRADNGKYFAGRIKEKTGIGLKILSGDEEARFSFAAAVQAAGKNCRTLVFDAGGGSTEFILGTAGRPVLSESTPLGSLTLLDKCMSDNDPPSAREFKEAATLARKIFSRADNVITEARKKDFVLIGVGGLISVLASVAMKMEEFSREKINGRKLTRAEIEEQISLYSSLDRQQRKKIPGMPANRAFAAPAGAVLALSVLECVGKDSLIVSACGLRYGAMLKLLEK